MDDDDTDRTNAHVQGEALVDEDNSDIEKFDDEEVKVRWIVEDLHRYDDIIYINFSVKIIFTPVNNKILNKNSVKLISHSLYD